VYITNSTTSLVFNEELNSFSSFMDYLKGTAVFNYKGASYALNTEGYVGLHRMFAGYYGVGINGENMDYSIEYAVNPDPGLDKTFTNIEFVADVVSPNEDYASAVTSADKIPFDSIEVWNDYQYGSESLKTGVFGNLQKKYKIWRVQIPRDNNSKFKHDRIRSPWMHLKLKNSNKDTKMVFHSLTIKYFK
jgi:hypothetical protein